MAKGLKQIWKHWPEECGNCGGSVEVLSVCPAKYDTEKTTHAYDGEKVRCAEPCGWESHIVIDEDQAYVDFDGNTEFLESGSLSAAVTKFNAAWKRFHQPITTSILDFLTKILTKDKNGKN